MLLYETMMEDCVMQDKTTTSDGLGGFTSSWQDGAHFRAAIVKNQSIEALVAEKQGVTELYTITVDKGVTLDFSRKLSGGFQIGPRESSYYISFSDETFAELIGSYLRPATKKLLFG